MTNEFSHCKYILKLEIYVWISLKVNAIDKELKAQLQIYRTTRNPTQKAQAKKKATQLLKKKKMYEQHINNLSNTQMTVDSANMDC